MKLYLEVTQDKYELPVRVAGNAEELAKLCETTANNIYSQISKHNKLGKPSKYRVVEATL